MKLPQQIWIACVESFEQSGQSVISFVTIMTGKHSYQRLMF